MYDVPEHDLAKVQRMITRSEIDERYSVLDDFNKPILYRKMYQKGKLDTVEKRMQLFFNYAPALCIQAVQQCVQHTIPVKKITHFITVSCTGLAAPGLDVVLMKQLGIPSHVHRSAINFMGCYAAIHALKQADAICKANKNAQVLLVDVELCTLHFQDTFSLENMASSSLFADGAAAVLVNNEIGLYKITDFYSDIQWNNVADMAWNISSTGFQMTLSNYIPSILAEEIEPMLMRSLQALSLQKGDIKHWAIHPGGKKIITEIAKALSLQKEDTQISRNVLRSNGNMSSVTILYVLQHMLQKIQAPNENVYCVAFGPGLTIESMFLQSC
jgi:alkylresorcinol/alkylpyrone synthase